MSAKKSEKKSKKKRAGRPKSGTGRADDTFSINSIEKLKAIADPVRQQLLEQFARKPATTKQAAVALGYQPTRLYHHVAKLESAGLIRLVETRPVRGTTEKYYSAVASRMVIDPRAFPDLPAKIAGEIALLGVVDGLLTNVRREVADYLGQIAEEPDEKAAIDQAVQDLLFVQVKVEADEETILDLREKIDQLVREVEVISKNRPDKADEARKFRLILGWYPRASAT